MNLKNNIILLFVLIFSLQSISQNYFNESMTTDLHEKYWFYRDRLKYFVIPGEGPGKSVVFGSRNHWESPDITIANQTIKFSFITDTEWTSFDILKLTTKELFLERNYSNGDVIRYEYLSN